MLSEVYINQTASFLPFDPVSNDEIEAVLGMVGGKPSRARRVILRSNGIQTRHYAIDRATGRVVMTNAQLTAQAVMALGEIGSVELLSCGTSSPDQMLPSHAVMVHGELKWPRLQVVSFAGICLSGAAALKHAWLAIRAGDVQRAVATGSELASASLNSRHYEAEYEHKLKELDERPEIAFEKDFLRWMLSDGAGALLLENQQRGELSLRIDWIELSSAANELAACMYHGAEKNEDGSLLGWQWFNAAQWGEKSIFSLKQDVRLLNENIVRATLAEPLATVVEKKAAHRRHRLVPAAYVIPVFCRADRTVSRRNRIADTARALVHNLASKGNTGSASPFIMLDELFHSAASGRAKSC